MSAGESRETGQNKTRSKGGRRGLGGGRRRERVAGSLASEEEEGFGRAEGVGDSAAALVVLLEPLHLPERRPR